MSNMRSGTILAALAVIALLLPQPFVVEAQQTFRPSSVSIEVIPNFPQPNQDVTLSISTYSFDVSRAYTVWRIDGEVVEEGYGISEISLNSGEAGAETDVTVDITIGDIELSRSITLAPLGVELMWESIDGYAPPFYKGKKLVVKEGRARVVAFPRIPKPGGGIYAADELVYDWEHNGTVMQRSSGYGKQSYTFTQSYINRDDRIYVTVSTLDGGKVARGNILLKPSLPELSLYRRTGPSQAQEYLRNGLDISRARVDITAVPYFFSAQTPSDGHLEYQWKVNGDSLLQPPEKATIQVVNPSNRQARVSVSLTVVNTETLFQEDGVSANINVE